MEKRCAVSRRSFVVDPEDLAFYEKCGVPAPTLCPWERQRRRAAWRNEHHLYHRRCDLSGHNLISIYPDSSPYSVYSNALWWSDEWNAEDYALSFDPKKSFFEQLQALRLRVPRLALYQKNAENSPYTNHVDGLKDCHLCVDVARSRNIYYSKWAIDCVDCLDCFNIRNSELCFECQNQRGGYRNIFAYYCESCSDSAFIYRCRGVLNCFMCTDLVHAQFCIRNVQLSEEDYRTRLASVNPGSHQQGEALKQEFFGRLGALPRQEFQLNCEECSGDYLINCKRVSDSVQIDNSWDARYCYESSGLTDCYDVFESGFECELQYECHACNRAKFSKFCHVCYDVSECDCCDSCHNCSKLFGCIGLRHKEYCILNKQYSRREYELLRAQIISKMKAEGEWGEFFPAAHSPFPYNCTYAQETHPLTKDSALGRGYRWQEEKGVFEKFATERQLPDDVRDAQDEVTSAAHRCASTGRYYKIIPQELELLKRIGAPLPRCSPTQRYLQRLNWRGVELPSDF